MTFDKCGGKIDEMLGTWKSKNSDILGQNYEILIKMFTFGMYGEKNRWNVGNTIVKIEFSKIKFSNQNYDINKNVLPTVKKIYFFFLLIT